MKYLILTILFITNANANYIPAQKVGVCGPLTVFTKLKRCEKVTGKTCQKIPFKYDCETFEASDEMTTDIEKPVWGTRSKIETCEDEETCKAAALEKKCPEKRTAYYNAEFSETWCNKILSYGQKKTGRKIVIENMDKKASKQAVLDTAKKDEKDKKNIIKALKTRLKAGESLTDKELAKILVFLLKAI